ncbi:MAG: hypothetical protein AAGG75_01420 [Bacteroidota bacterium]
MLSIFATTEQRTALEEIIESEDRLAELVDIRPLQKAEVVASDTSLIVEENRISLPLDWHNLSPPYLLNQQLPFDAALLLGLIFNKLRNMEKAWNYLQAYPNLQYEIGIMNRLRNGFEMEEEEWRGKMEAAIGNDEFERYRRLHNAAVIRHYGHLNPAPRQAAPGTWYQEALEAAPDAEHYAFTARHFAVLMLDANALTEAEDLLNHSIDSPISEEAKNALRSVLTNIWMKQLKVPYDAVLLEKLKTTLWQVLEYYENHNREVEAGLILIDAAHIANISESYTESLGYLSKAIGIFEQAELPELVGNAQLRKGTLLYTWAQNGNPQFYKPAIEAYQQSLKVFRQSVAPDVFAEIHHQLGMLYAEMPAENKKRGIWAGVASASFQEALNFYNKEQHPYEYAMICNNFGNALSKFPPAIHSDNFEKSLFYYQEALSIRTADYPYERAITLLNYLEASWKVGNATDAFNQKRYEDMLLKAREIGQLVQEPDILNEAQKHLDMLEELKKSVS